MRKLPERRAALTSSPAIPRAAAQPSALRLGPDRVADARVAPRTPVRVETLAPGRCKVQFTASAEFREKLERLQALMGASATDGDLATVIEQAVSEKLERLEAKRFGKTNKPRKTLKQTDTRAASRHVPAAVRRSVHARNTVQKYGFRCHSSGVFSRSRR